MRKFKQILFVGLAFFVVLFTSCKKDSDAEQKKEFNNVEAYHKCTFAQELLSIADVNVIVTDFTGKSVTEAVKSTVWEKTFTTTVFPRQTSVLFTVKLKDGVDLSGKTSWDLATRYYFEFRENYLDASQAKVIARGTPIIAYSVVEGGTYPIISSKVANYIETRLNMSTAAVCSINKDNGGSYTGSLAGFDFTN